MSETLRKVWLDVGGGGLNKPVKTAAIFEEWSVTLLRSILCIIVVIVYFEGYTCVRYKQEDLDARIYTQDLPKKPGEYLRKRLSCGFK